MAEFVPRKCPPGCVYAMQAHNGGDGRKVEHCGYILYTDKPRGCDPGKNCKRYQKGDRRHAALRVRQRRSGGCAFQWDERAGYRMWKEGHTDREIADALGTKRDIVGDTRRRKWMKEDK